MDHAQPRPGAYYIHDQHGNRYRVGERDRDVLGRSRVWVLVAAFVAMLAVSPLQYAFGAALPQLSGDRGLPLSMFGWAFAVWAVCQSVIGVAVATLRRRGASIPRLTTLIGALLCAAGLAALAYGHGPAALVAGYGVAGGVGTGLVYASCLGVVAGWYPEHPARVGLVSGAFSYGSLPLVFALPYVSGVTLPLGLAAIAVLVLAGSAATLLNDPPREWWPADRDPRRWISDKSFNSALRANRTAVRVFSAGELPRLTSSRLLYVAVGCVSAVALFDVVYLGVFGLYSGLDARIATAAIGAFAAAGGIVRVAAVHAGARIGYRTVVLIALPLVAIAQLAALAAGVGGSGPALLFAAALAGAGTGACYSLLPRLVIGYFGEHPELSNFGMLYSAKAIGGIVGAGIASTLVVPDGYPIGFGAATGVAVLGALAFRAVRRPGLLRLIPECTRPAVTFGA